MNLLKSILNEKTYIFSFFIKISYNFCFKVPNSDLFLIIGRFDEYFFELTLMMITIILSLMIDLSDDEGDDK